ncbi:hypothetical protein FSP39_017024 [Pinctada imbricata]|uniref:Uncharacterized protein n=1 Tax=Pinctada imbricata TaxID=66713 RepID=A0AA89C1L8_PINIB|nr:hypothetical protein FSP39_017024 [Pinctada imbricata]
MSADTLCKSLFLVRQLHAREQRGSQVTIAAKEEDDTVFRPRRMSMFEVCVTFNEPPKIVRKPSYSVYNAYGKSRNDVIFTLSVNDTFGKGKPIWKGKEFLEGRGYGGQPIQHMVLKKKLKKNELTYTYMQIEAQNILDQIRTVNDSK